MAANDLVDDIYILSTLSGKMIHPKNVVVCLITEQIKDI